jgi:predicted nucleotidyltransferase
MPDAVAGLLAARRARRAELLRAAAVFAGSLDRACSAFVVGSVARGDFGAGSDIDAVIIAPWMPASPRARSELLYRTVSGGIEPKGSTPGEWRDLVRRGVAWTSLALREAVWLNDDLGLRPQGA